MIYLTKELVFLWLTDIFHSVAQKTININERNTVIE